MPYCYNCGKPVKEVSKYCPECGFEFKKIPSKAKEKEEPEKQVSTEKVIIKEKKSSAISIVLIFLLIIGIILFVVYLVQEGALSSGGGISKIIDPCETAFDNCNRDCGEGWGSGLCKTGCTYDYNKCKENR